MKFSFVQLNKTSIMRPSTGERVINIPADGRYSAERAHSPTSCCCGPATGVLLMKSSIRRAVLGLALVPILTIATTLPAFAAPVAPRTVVQDQPSWTSSASAQADTADAVVENLSVVLKLRDAAGAEALATAVSDPAGAQYRKYISSSEWRARYAPTDQTVAQVTGWLTSQGFSDRCELAPPR